MQYVFTCSDCKRKITHTTPHSYGAVGYGVFKDGRKVCYDCCAIRDKAEMVKTGKAVLYLAKGDGWYKVTNWPGTMAYRVFRYSRGKHNIAGTRIDVWFTGPDGECWWGVVYGRNTMLCHCRRVKST
jgi:hypothetical protein